MKKSVAFLCFLFPFFVFSQNFIEWKDDFSDGNFTENPVWSGTNANFKVNAEFQLQSCAAATSRSFLSTTSEAFENATWECSVKINYTTSSSNYASVYIIADRADISAECFGYYVQIGGTNDEISLYRQEGAKKTKIIDGIDKSVDTNPVEVRIKVTRDKNGVFTLYRKLTTDADFVKEGEEAADNNVLGSKYFGALYANSSTTGNAYFFDDISVKGKKLLDETAPVWTSLTLIAPNKLVLNFSEPVDCSQATFQADNGMGKPANTSISTDKYSVTLSFSTNFEKGKIYTVDALNIKDVSGNPLENTQKKVGIVEKIEFGDLVINEIMFDAPDEVPEYVEIFNVSGKVLELSRVTYGVRKTDGTYAPTNFFPMKTLILPHQHIAIATDADKVRACYQTPDTAYVLNVTKWSALNNTSANLLIANEKGDTVYDEIRYDSKWHHPLLKQSKGVSLERINPLQPGQSPESWHSASSEVHYGTPGYRNSQFRAISPDGNGEKWVWLDPEAFTPDDDGKDDVCLIRYKVPDNGFSANVIIFNAVGVRIKQIASNVLLSAEGTLTWDGRTERGQSVNPGIYVLYFEMVNAASGVKKTEKIPVVVSAR